MSIASETHLSLLERARMQDEVAWSELVDLYSPLIVQWCRRSRVGPESTADCIQEVFMAVSRSLDTFHAPGTVGAFRGWLWTITRNKLLDAARRNGRQTNALGGSSAMRHIHSISDPNDLPLDEPSCNEDVQALTRMAIAQIESRFSEQTWKAFWRCVVDGISTETVAKELGWNSAAVRQARSRVMRRLREQLGDVR